VSGRALRCSKLLRRIKIRIGPQSEKISRPSASKRFSQQIRRIEIRIGPSSVLHRQILQNQARKACDKHVLHFAPRVEERCPFVMNKSDYFE
jgi:hypothetical protein